MAIRQGVIYIEEVVSGAGSRLSLSHVPPPGGFTT